MSDIWITGGVGQEITLDSFKGLTGEDTVYLSTPGGSVFEAYNIYNFISSMAEKPRLVLSGSVASAGTYIAMAFDEVDAYDNVYFMIHNSSTLSIGDKNEIKKDIETLEAIDAHISSVYMSKLSLSSEELKLAMDSETSYNKGQLEGLGFLTGNFLNNKEVEMAEQEKKEVEQEIDPVAENKEVDAVKDEELEMTSEVKAEESKEVKASIDFDIKAFGDQLINAYDRGVKAAQSKGIVNASKVEIDMQDTAEIKAVSKTSVLDAMGFQEIEGKK